MDVSLFHPTSQHVPVLAIFVMVHEAGTHTGILHRNRGVLYTLDLMWHERLRAMIYRDNHPCVIPKLEPEEENDVTGMCRLIASRQHTPDPQRIPYGIGPPNNVRFNRDGELVLEGGLGLTCSTFVLTVFESVGISLADLTGWVARPDDVNQHQRFVEMMADGIQNFAPPADRVHVARVAKAVASIRVRPEEAAGAALAAELPASFEEAEQGGRWILEQIRGR